MSLESQVLKAVDTWAGLWRSWFPERTADDMSKQAEFLTAIAKLRTNPEVRHYMAESLRAQHEHNLVTKR